MSGSHDSSTPRSLRTRLAAGENLLGAWSCLPGPVAASVIAATSGLDYVVADLQHGQAGETDLPGICAAVATQGVVPLARVRSSTVADVGRALDLGAHGVFLPNVRDVDHVTEVLGFCQYPPVGVRSYGRLFAGVEDPVRFIVLETREALDDLDRILDLAELDGIYVGPMDLAHALGHAATPDDEHMAGVIADVLDRCAARNVPVGVHTGEGRTAVQYYEHEVRLVNAFTDTVVLAEAAAHHVCLAQGRVL